MYQPHVACILGNITSSDSRLAELDPVVTVVNGQKNDSESMVWERVEIKKVWRKIFVYHHHYQDDTKTFFLSGTTHKKNLHDISTFPYLFHQYTVKQLNQAEEINQDQPGLSM